MSSWNCRSVDMLSYHNEHRRLAIVYDYVDCSHKPPRPCSEFLTELEWNVLVAILSPNGDRPATPPPIADVVTEIAKLGGYLARKKDGPPGTLALWRGWKRLIDIVEGWSMALRLRICG